jgi:enoyl reductase
VIEHLRDTIGEPYAKGKADRTPPCGHQVPPLLRRRHLQTPGHRHRGDHLDRHGQPNPTQLPNGTFGNDQDVAVQETQSVNR